MYTVEHNDKLYVLLREIDTTTHFGGVMSFDIDGNERLINPSCAVSTKGICPCHLAVTNDDIYVVNYLSGNITSFFGKTDTHNGAGVNLPRQDMAHTHFVAISPDKKYLLSCDLGLDSIYTYDFGLNVQSVSKVPSGHGARHLAYSSDGKYVYCVNELASTVSVFKYDDGKLILCDTYPCMLKDTKNNTSDAIRYNNGYVYVSNRGEDTIVCFKVQGDRLEFVSRTFVGGSFPRDFDFCDNYIICTNKHTNNVTVFEVNGGNLKQTDNFENIADPLCVTVI